MRSSSRAAVGLIVLSLFAGHAGAASKPTAKPATKPAAKQVVTGPVATYWVDTKTNSGMTLGGAGGKPSMGSIMNMMKGGDNVSHSLNLRLGSTNAAPAEAVGTHLPPVGLNGGKPLPLYWKAAKAGPVETPERTAPDSYEPPKGKILIFWGCGEHAPKNQPVVLDLSKLADPAARVEMLKQMVPAGSLTLDNVVGPLPSTAKGYTEWPNVKNTRVFEGDDSLAGAHTIKAAFSPDINFTLDPSQDFLPAINITGNDKTTSGAVPLSWAAMPRSKGFIVTAVGGGQDNTVVMWTSAEMQTPFMGLSPEYLTANDVERLQAKKALLPGTATGCTVPAEVGNAAQALMYGVTAYGGDTVMSYPPRPEDVNTPWNIQWQTKVRYRSTTGGLLGQDLGMAAAQENGKTGEKSDGKKKKKSGMFGELVKQGLGGGLIP
ncbi:MULTISPECIES: hypothetical protein [Asticcacaulis]|uniref:hypothetical protein n=1 Tax=Asticcacaulis TaxID=76890 RepID=UPI001AE8B8C7|nr:MULTISPECIES: hypothetical protein [Asticcacaulis]MBP2160932.1 hypothetical protein [Asticcacaulis solisilvae]MDR6801864.1 hypothetical protein [Asticcacaulis sp. BE141]